MRHLVALLQEATAFGGVHETYNAELITKLLKAKYAEEDRVKAEEEKPQCSAQEEARIKAEQDAEYEATQSQQAEEAERALM